jgi:serine/threonine-protein kinase HipA
VNELLVLLDGREAGVVRQERGRLSFNYAGNWRSAPGAYPLSLSMPLAAAEHPHAAIEPFIWGLLPDNELVLSRWAQKFHVSARNAFSLISHVGEDCAGAVQFLRPERRDELTSIPPAPTEWLTEADVANRLRALQADAGAGRIPRDTGQFSLAGAQPKTALLFDGQRWGVPSGRTPTTHILKPQTGVLDGHAENEHLCLRLARALGLPTAESDVLRFDDVTAIAVERYDRVDLERSAAARNANAASLAKQAAKAAKPGGPAGVAYASDLASEAGEDAWLAKALIETARTIKFARVHQEDFCQALRIHPSRKYQNDGGPGPKDVIQCLRDNVSSHQLAKGSKKFPFAADDDVWTFIDALIFNWLIGGTDAHAKNYSLLIGGGGMVRLAPLYDIASILAYPDIDPHKAKLAMKIGDEYRLRDIRLSDWRKLAASVRVDGDMIVERVRAMARALPDRLSDEVKLMRASGLSHRIIDRLAGELPKRAAGVAGE